MKMKLLAVCDTPTMETGFARVARNLLSRWHDFKVFDDIWVWGIQYQGFPHGIPFLANRICPAQTPAAPLWYDRRNLERLLHLLETERVGATDGGFTHLWLMQDTFLLYPIADALRKLCHEQKIIMLLYFPIDAPIEPEWANIIEAADFPVAYCKYGLREATKALMVEATERSVARRRRNAIARIKTIPHGVDTNIYRPVPESEEPNMRMKVRQSIRNQVRAEDFFIVSVCANQKRKGLAQTLQIVARIKRNYPDVPVKLYMHMPAFNEGEDLNLREIALQMGVIPGRDVFFGDDSFHKGHAKLSEEYLNGYYNAADLVLSTSYGEGWGLPIIEAMAAHCAVAGPAHTSMAEIMADDRGILFNTLGEDVLPADNSRVRPRSDVDDAAAKIVTAWKENKSDPASYGSLDSYAQRGYEFARSSFMNWDRIAGEWVELFLGGPIV